MWYRSLYWRIAFGFVALLATLLVIQAGLFIWLTVIVGRSTLGPAQLASEVATEIGTALTESPDLDVNEFVRSRFGSIYQPFLVVMEDGRSVPNRPDALPPGFANFARMARRRTTGSEVPTSGRAEGQARGFPRGRRPIEIAPIVAAGVEREVGFVAVPGSPPPASVVMRQLGPTLTWVAVALLVSGSAVMALLIFRPAHKRLRMLERAATALGEGRTDVRAVETGGDEVTSLARAFNRMADDLSAREAALVASDRARRQLLADVSHELMTPLAAIRGYTETLAMPEVTLDEPTRRRYLDIVGDETRKLEAIIGDLLDLARLEGGGGTLSIEPVRVSELFGRITDRHGPTIREQRIDVQVRVDPPNLALEGDPHRLEQALQNLAANALRHTPAGGRLQLGARCADGRVVLSVRDSGPGIPPEHLPKIFDRFYKTDASRTQVDGPTGSGLGLSIVKAIVERHGGSVTAANAGGGGALFEISLPGQNNCDKTMTA